MDKLSVKFSPNPVIQSSYAFFIDAKFSAATYLTMEFKKHCTTGKKFIEQLE